MAIRYYALVYTPKATIDDPSNIMRIVDEPESYKIERLNPDGEWVMDMRLAAHIDQGEPGAERVSAKKAKQLVARFKQEQGGNKENYRSQ